MRYSFSLFLPLFLTVAAPVVLANPDIPRPNTLSGTIEFVACGEMDPFELGDSCIVYGVDADGAAIGLVTTDLRLVDQYGYEGLNALTGQPLRLRTDTLQPLDDIAVITVLDRLPFSEVEGRLFYWWDGTGILGK